MLSLLLATVLALVPASSLPTDEPLPTCGGYFDPCPTAYTKDGAVELGDIDGAPGVDGTPPDEEVDPGNERIDDPADDCVINDGTATAVRTCGNEVPKNVDGEPAVTLTDLATVRPAAPVLAGDVPVGYGLMNAPTNVVASADEQTVTTALFGLPVQVLFVPVGYVFNYGDGGSRTSDTGGETWQQLGVGQFTPTATTHVFHARGSYTVTVTVDYAPYVNFGLGNGWRPVDGTVSATSTGYSLQIVEARTALVAHDCNEDPTGVGCPVR